MKLVILSDIFGKTPELEAFAASITSDYVIFSPYANNTVFNDEQNAYQYFVDNVGIDNYFAYVRNQLKNNQVPYCLLGFSVGASIAWRLSGEARDIAEPTKLLAFYGGQIRHYSQLTPKLISKHKVELIFPHKEQHFNVNDLVKTLKTKVKVSQVPYAHGFMNPRSTNFSATGFRAYQKIIAQWLNTENPNTA